MWTSTKIYVVLAILIALWAIPRIRYASEVEAAGLEIFNKWEQADSRFFLDWSDKIANGDVLGRTPNHPLHEWHITLAKKWSADNPEQVSELRKELPIDADETALHQLLWNRWYGGVQFHQEPLYPYMLAALQRAFGDAYVAGYAFQSFLGIVNGLLLFLLTRRIFGTPQAIVAGVIYAFSGFLMFHEQTILRTTATCTMTLLLIWQAVGLYEAPNGKRWVLFGLSMGAAILLQSIFLLFFLGFIALLCWSAAETRARTLQGAGLAAATILAVLSPAFARNVAVGAPVFSLSSVGSVTFIAVNHPTYASFAGWSVSPETAALVAISESRPTTAAIETIRAHDGLGSILSMASNKLRAALYGIEWYGNENFYGMREFAPVLRITAFNLFMLVPLALVGIVATFRRKPVSRILIIGALVHLAVLVGLYVVGRFRAPMAIVLIPFAAWTSWEILRTLSDRRTLPWGITIGLLVATVTCGSLMKAKEVEWDRTVEYKLVFNTHYAPRLEKHAKAKEFDSCVKLFDEYLDKTPRFLQDTSSITSVSRNMSDLAKYFSDRRKSYGDLLAVMGRPVEAEKQRSIARQLQRIADVK